MTTEIVTLPDIQNRTDTDYNLLKTGYPLSGYEENTGPPEATVESFGASGVTLDVTTFFEGRLCQPEFRIIKDLKVLANIVANLGSPISPGPKKFILISSDDEEADYLENKLIDGDGILVTKLTESNGFESLQLDVRTKNSIEIDLDILQLVGDVSNPGIDKFYGTSAAGTKGWHSFTTQDKRVSISAVDSASDFLEDKIVDSDGIQITKTTVVGFQTLDFSINVKNSIEIDSDYLQFINDESVPGNSKFYGTSTVGTKGWQSLPIKNSIEEDSAQLQFINDESVPGNSKFYGTSTVGVKGWQSLPVKKSLEENGNELQLVNDVNVPGNAKFYGTSDLGVKGWYDFEDVAGTTVSITLGDIGSGYLDDKVIAGDGILTTIDNVTMSNGEQLLDFSVLVKNSIEIDSDYLQLINDINIPGNSKFYGTSTVGVKGWQSLPTKNSIVENANELQLVNDSLVPGLQRYYGTDIAGVKGFFSLPALVDGALYSEDSVQLVSNIDSAGVADYTISFVNDENLPGNRKYYGTDELGNKGWHDREHLPNEIGLGGDPDSDSTGTNFPVLRRCTVNPADGSISDIGTDGDDIVLSGDGIIADQQLVAAKVWNSVWNDLVDFQDLDDKLRFGKCYYDSVTGAKICNKRCQKSVIGLASDTFGMALGSGAGGVPIAVSGWVLAYVDKIYEIGTPLTNDKVGNLTEMNIEEKHNFPERIVAIYKKEELARTWGLEGMEIQVNGRHWVKVK